MTFGTLMQDYDFMGLIIRQSIHSKLARICTTTDGDTNILLTINAVRHW